MKDIKIMLLGLSIMLAVIAFHLFVEGGLFTDFIAIGGLVVVIAGFCAKDDKKP